MRNVNDVDRNNILKNPQKDVRNTLNDGMLTLSLFKMTGKYLVQQATFTPL